ncbi:hypothetical protein ACJ72_08622 [Emergomyces africanus]|uniref:Uncharacterized protein n=1 Tax=Emergomyces africanus TaxID=1955775 RepID=A0A1B7NJU8_9EURO|nr:hypothetical protein ACJ72_08622 [Emergomyces africanus]
MAVSLHQIQPIISFPPSCTRAYSTNISGCVVSDFINRGSCSPECIEGLETLSRSLNMACVGSRAFSRSLIGLFFQGLGVQTLCPNARGGREGGRREGGGEIQSPTRSNPPDISRSTKTRRPPPTHTQPAQTEDPSTGTPLPTQSSTTSTSTSHESTNTRSTFTTSDPHTTTSPPLSTTASDPATTQTKLNPFTTRSIDPEKDPFGGFGNAFDIIAPNRAATTGQSRKMAIGFAASAVLFSIQLAWQ